MTYVISDLHGRLSARQFQGFLQSAGFDNNSDTLYVLGDMIDRGPFGIDLLAYVAQKGYIRVLRGNHEQMLLEIGDGLLLPATEENRRNIMTPEFYQKIAVYIRNGGASTLEALDEIPLTKAKKLLRFLKSTSLYTEVKVLEQDYILCHSGIGHFLEGKALAEYTVEDLLWYRMKPGEVRTGPIIICGHTPASYLGAPDGEFLYGQGFINIDTSNTNCIALLRLEDQKQFRLYI